jgi:hypothetical protein
VLGLPVAFWLLLASDLFAFSTLTQFFAPAEQSIIPLIVAETDLLSANSLYTTTMMASVIVGFAVGRTAAGPGRSPDAGSWGSPTTARRSWWALSYLVAGLCLMTMDPWQRKSLGSPRRSGPVLGRH